MNTWAAPGVHCVSLIDWKEHVFENNFPIAKNQVVTIRSVYEDPFSPRIGLRFVGIINPIEPKLGVEYGYHIQRFRPVENKRLDVFRNSKIPLPEDREFDGEIVWMK